MSRRSDLAMIHIGAKALGMDPQDKNPMSPYRTMLNTICGVQTSADLGYRDRQAVIKHLKSKGWTPTPRGQKKPSDAQSRLIHHIWNSLADAGIVKHRSGLGNWLKTYTKHDHPNGTGWQRPEFLPKHVRRNVIEQLKKWANRTGVEWQ